MLLGFWLVDWLGEFEMKTLMGNKFQFLSSPQSGDIRFVSQPEMPAPNDLKQSICVTKRSGQKRT